MMLEAGKGCRTRLAAEPFKPAVARAGPHTSPSVATVMTWVLVAIALHREAPGAPWSSRRAAARPLAVGPATPAFAGAWLLPARSKPHSCTRHAPHDAVAGHSRGDAGPAGGGCCGSASPAQARAPQAQDV